jgi:cell division protein ZapA
MKNRVTVNVAGQSYTLLAAEDQFYVEKIASHVDSSIKALRDNSQTSLLDAAILTALNLADEHYRDLEAAENLRHQIKEALDEAAKLKLELSDAKRTIFKLQSKK